MRRIGYTLFLLFLINYISAQSNQEATQKILKRANIPGLSLAYLSSEGSVTVESYGVKEIKKEGSIDEKTLFSAASLSKPIVGYMVMQLVDQGEIDLDQPLAEYFDYPDVAGEAFYRQVTARHVLSHTSGLPNWRPRREGGELKFKRAPGEQFGYSGEGYVWLSKVLESINSKAFEELAQEMVFQPLGMTLTSYIWRDTTEQNYALPHDPYAKPRKKWKSPNPNAAASLQTTASDYARFLQAIYRGDRLSAKSKAAMFSPQSEVISYGADGKIDWGLSVGIQEKPDGKEFWHWGDNGTFKAYFTVNIETGEGLVYFANSSNGLAITEELTDLYLGTRQPSVRWNDYPKLGFWYRLKKIFK